MSQSLSKVTIHIVFSTKHRRPWLRDQGLRIELQAYMATILRDNVHSPAMIIDGTERPLRGYTLLGCVSCGRRRAARSRESFGSAEGTAVAGICGAGI